MAREKNNWLLVVGIIALLLIVFGIVKIGNFGLSSVYNFESGKVYVPLIGTLTCRETQNVSVTLTDFSNSGGATGIRLELAKTSIRKTKNIRI